jgi:DNA-binding MarR family transcriptional regulator
MQKLGRSLAYAAQQQRRYLCHHLAHLEIGPRTLPFYLYISHNEGLSQKELMERLFVDKTRTTKAVNHLEKSGYVERRSIEQDLRVKGVFLTEAGHKVLPEVERILKNLDGLLSDDLSENDIDNFIHMLEAFGSAVRKDLGDEK